jgi:hypothetical protein
MAVSLGGDGGRAGVLCCSGLWAFEFGKDIAGLDGGAAEELVQLREELARMRAERDQAQSVANTSRRPC